jgi:hypothetical protein
LFLWLSRSRQRPRGVGQGEFALALGGDDGNGSLFAAAGGGLGGRFRHDGTSVSDNGVSLIISDLD